jgi:hypothetical protein
MDGPIYVNKDDSKIKKSYIHDKILKISNFNHLRNMDLKFLVKLEISRYLLFYVFIIILTENSRNTKTILCNIFNLFLF